MKTQLKAFLLFLILAVCLAFPMSLRAQQPVQHGFKKKLMQASLALYGSKDEKSHFLCTATVFQKTKDGYLLLSAGHCVQDVPAGVVFSVSEKIAGDLIPVTVVKSRDDDERPLDFAVFQLKTKKKYPVIPLGNEKLAHVGDTVLNANYSEGIIEQLSEGKISSQIMLPSPKHKMNVGRFMAQIYGGPGSSGAAVVYKKHIIGIIRGGYDSNIGAVVTPISGFHEFMSLPDVPVVEPQA